MQELCCRCVHWGQASHNLLMISALFPDRVFGDSLQFAGKRDVFDEEQQLHVSREGALHILATFLILNFLNPRLWNLYTWGLIILFSGGRFIYFYICEHVCAFMHACMHARLCVCACTSRQKPEEGVRWPPYHSLSCSFRAGSLPKPGTFLTYVGGSKARDSPVSILLGAGVTCLLHGFWDLNSGPHDYTEGAFQPLIHQSSPPPPRPTFNKKE